VDAKKKKIHGVAWERFGEKQPLHMVKERNESSMKLLRTLLEQ